jgi:hypothetical protein
MPCDILGWCKSAADRDGDGEIDLDDAEVALEELKRLVLGIRTVANTLKVSGVDIGEAGEYLDQADHVLNVGADVTEQIGTIAASFQAHQVGPNLETLQRNIGVAQEKARDLQERGIGTKELQRALHDANGHVGGARVRHAGVVAAANAGPMQQNAFAETRAVGGFPMMMQQHPQAGLMVAPGTGMVYRRTM